MKGKRGFTCSEGRKERKGGRSVVIAARKEEKEGKQEHAVT